MLMIRIDKAEKIPEYLKDCPIIIGDYGRKVILYDYHHGSVHIPVIDSIDELEERIRLDNIDWAKARLK